MPKNLSRNKVFTFIDLFAGIGGFHLALHDLGGECVFVNEFDKYARSTYMSNFLAKNSRLFSDKKRELHYWESIKNVTLSNELEQSEEIWKKNIKKIIPKFDILCAGFPCQPFSGIGKRRGFDDDRGTLFNDIVRIIEARQPKVVFLENVRNIVTHDNRRTFESILDRLDKAGYYVHKERNDTWNIFRASEFGLPTARSRFYLVAFRKGTRGEGKFKFPEAITPEGMTLAKFFKDKKWPDRVGKTIRVGGRASPVKKKENGEWFIDRRSWDTYIWGGKNIKGKIFGGEKHVLTIEEAKKMMGFPKDFCFPVTVSPNQAFRQLGNSVAVNTIREIGKQIVKLL